MHRSFHLGHLMIWHFAWMLGLAWPLASSTSAAETAAELFQQAALAANESNSEQAEKLATAALAQDPKLAQAYYLRGRERFRLGKVAESVADFDQYVALRPELASRQWERGISCYYAGRFQQGADQFALYQTYHDNDVENSVWRYLCMVPLTGVEKAREAMLPIRDDRRIPMMQIYDLYRGKLQPADVLKAIDADQPTADARRARAFYAHLYLGLYYEVAKEPTLAKKYIDLAADPELAKNPGLNRYMWDVARVHAQQLQARSSKRPTATSN
jgi:lipoprotein NlpI